MFSVAVIITLAIAIAIAVIIAVAVGIFACKFLRYISRHNMAANPSLYGLTP